MREILKCSLNSPFLNFYVIIFMKTHLHHSILSLLEDITAIELCQEHDCCTVHHRKVKRLGFGI